MGDEEKKVVSGVAVEFATKVAEAAMTQKPSKEEPIEDAITEGQQTPVSGESDDLVYEPVSPTPLPDSPASENSKHIDTKPSPFEEVINKKAEIDMGASPPSSEISKGGKKKKQSA